MAESTDGSGSPSADQPGEATAQEAYRLLADNPKAQLVDVRTRAEWSFVGLPWLEEIGKEVVLAEWQRFPTMEVDPSFVQTLAQELDRRGAGKGDPVLFLCRSGARSQSAADAMRRAGWTATVNVTGGFEGPPDGERHRGEVDGWKAAGLPWVQS